MSGVERIAAERERQIARWGTENDLGYTDGQLAAAAMAYLDDSAFLWPWDASTFKPGEYTRNLEKAGALIAAELDRLHAGEAAPAPPPVRELAKGIFGNLPEAQ